MSPTIVGGAGALLVAAQAVLIVWLLVSRARNRQAEARNNAILRALPDLMFVQAREGNVFVDYCARDAALLVVPPAQFLGKPMRDVMPPALNEMFEKSIERLFNGEEPVVIEYELPVTSGEMRQFEARLVRCERDKFLSIVRDITPQTQAVAALETAQSELHRAARLATLGEFAGSIAHELAQPLSAMIANSQASIRLLDRSTPDVAEARESLRGVVNAGRVASDVIERTRKLFRGGNPQPSAVDLADVVNEACAMVSPMLRQRHVTLDVKLDVANPVIQGDRVQLRQVLLNLISNGIQAMEKVDADAPRRLTISATVTPPGTARLTVSDTGVGLANVDRGRLFNESYTTKTDGMGWGLSISRSIVEAHGGQLWAEPNEGAGASFSFTIPLPS